MNVALDQWTFGPDDKFVQFPDFGSKVQQCVMPVMTRVDGEFLALGTAFVVNSAGGLLLTAYHVAEEALKYKNRRLGVDGKYYGHYELYVLFASDADAGDGKFVGGILGVAHASRVGETDVALCVLGPRPLEISLPQVALTVNPPAEGEVVLGIGYHAMRFTPSGAVDTLEYTQSASVTRGRVKRVYIHYRDAGQMKFPCFSTDAQFEHGMSGGPVFNEQGQVCGLITGGSTDDGIVHHGYGSLLWPTMGLAAELDVDGERRVWTLYELAQRGLIKVSGLDAVTARAGEAGPVVEYRSQIAGRTVHDDTD
jgi:hypothetical protein